MLKVPEETESFEDVYFIPEEEAEVASSEPDAAVIEITSSAPVGFEEYGDINAPATLSPHMTMDGATGKLRKYVPPPEPVAEPEKKPDRKALLKTLEDAGVEVKKGTRTTTLQRMVDDLEEED